jgi:hypothetical protein
MIYDRIPPHDDGIPPYYNPYGEEDPCPECGQDPCVCELDEKGIDITGNFDGFTVGSDADPGL